MKQVMDLVGSTHFIGAWVRNPLQTGTLWPSGQARRLGAVEPPGGGGVGLHSE